MGEASLMLEPCGMWCTTSLPSLPSPLWPGVVAHDRVLSISQSELFDIQTVCKQMTNSKLNYLKKKFDHLIMCKQMTDV